MKTLLKSFPALFCLVLFEFTTDKLNAQCTCDPYNDDFDIETSSGETADDYDIFDGVKVLLNYDFVVDINFTIDASILASVPGVTIFVQSPNTLTITGGSIITANTTLWDGIHVDDGAHIVINEASEISNAYRGVWIDNNSTTAADFDITDHHSGDDAWTIKIKNTCNPLKYYPDLDEDGFGDITSMYIYSCNDTIGFANNNLDCNDSLFSINPSVKEGCNYIDDNCNGLIDEGFTYLHTYEDFDGDEFGNENIDSISCLIPEGFVLDNTDCDDTIPEIYPGAIEVLNGFDDDCDQIADEGLEIDEQPSICFSIYPNPTDNFVSIINSLNLIAYVQVFNNVGQVVIANREIYGNDVLFFEYLPSGIYLIEITTSNKKESLVLIRN
mgnify:CR=1 FL=1